MSGSQHRSQPRTTARLLMLGGTAVRINRGCRLSLVPSRMAAAPRAPDTDHEPDARLFVRGFGGHQFVTGAVTLATARTPQLSSPALMLNLLIDTLDMTSIDRVDGGRVSPSLSIRTRWPGVSDE